MLSVSSKNETLTVTAKKPFSFNLSRYTQEQFINTRHDYELTESDSTVLCIDYKMSGVGSNSCGPELAEQYRFNEENFKFDFQLRF